MIAIDDFGTATRSLATHTFPVDALRAPHVSIASALRPADSPRRASSGRSLWLRTVAVGRDQAQLEHLRELGCDRGQGYLFSLPRSRSTPLRGSSSTEIVAV